MPDHTHGAMDSAEDLAASTAHALNNALGVLAAATDWLDDLPDGPATDRARQALVTGEGRVQAISDAFAWLALSPDELRADAASDRRYAWTESETRRCETALHGAAEATLSVAPGAEPEFVLDGETLRALLVCLAVALRRRAGSGAVITVRLAPLQGARWGAEVLADRPVPEGPAAGVSAHPCDFAAASAADRLAAMGGALQRVEQGWRLWPDAGGGALA